MTEQQKTTTAISRRRTPPSQQAASDAVQQILSPTINEICGVRGEVFRAAVQGYHKMGRVLIRDRERLQQAEQKRKMYQIKTPSLQTIAEAVHIDAPTLSKCRKFAELYDESEVKELLTPEMTWSHIRHLVTVNTEAARQRLIERINTENLTADELSREITREFGNRKPGAGKKARTPTNVNKAISKLLDWAEKSQGRILNNLFGTEYDLVEAILAEPSDKLTRHKREDVAKTAARIRAMGEALRYEAQRIEGTLPEIDQRIAAQEKQQEETSDEQDPFDPHVLARSAGKPGAER